MRLVELFLKEKINLSQHEHEISAFIKVTIAEYIKKLINDKHYPGLEFYQDQFDSSGESHEYTEYLIDKLDGIIRHVLQNKLYTLAKEKFYPPLEHVGFIKTEANGYADRLAIYINDSKVDNMAKKIITKLFDTVLNSYNNNERNDGLNGFVDDMIENPNSYVGSRIFDWVNRDIDSIVSTFIHELVHVMQHGNQYKKGKNSTEYRSYLGKKDEFKNLHSKAWKSNFDLPGDESKNYYKLYYSSPQEIGAHAHNIALQVIIDNIKEYVNPESITPEQYNKMKTWLEGSTIPAYVDDYLRDYLDKKNPEEYKIYKRYYKLVYQEVLNYIHSMFKKFIKANSVDLQT